MTQTIGQRLKAEREAQRLTLEKVFEATRIRMQYLQALEEDDLSVMPSPVQSRGYLRNYAEFLGFDVDEVLNELRAVSTQAPSGQVIGPADEQSAVLGQELKSLGPSSTIETMVAPEMTEPTASVEEVVTSVPSDFDKLQGGQAEVIVPLKPKPARRKKADSQPKPATAEPTTKRRGRKKIAPEIIPVVEVQSDEQSPVETIVPPAEAVPEPERVEEPAVPMESSPEPVEKETEFQSEEAQPVDVSDSLWQSWLNRVGSVLAGRMKRRTLEVKEPPVPENEPIVVTEPEPPVAINEQHSPFENSDAIFKEIGRELRSRRELLSLHFDEVERNTHVKAHYLDALERGALDELPSTVQTRGMLSNYATFLDLDVDVLLLRFADALQARHRERNPQKPPRKPGQPIIANMPPVRTFIAGDMIFGVGMAILLVGFAIWGVSRVMAIQSQREADANPTAPSISDVLLASPDPSAFTATPTFLPVEAFPGEPTVTVEIPTQNVNAPVQLNLIAMERTYMRVTVDGEVVFDGRVVPGNAYPFEAENQVEVLVGSGAAIRTVYNGRDLGLMGTFGQVVNNVYTGTEIMTPTGLPSMTPTVTLTPTNTAPATATLQSTNTAVPSATAVP
ncbi:MAG TPA: RodZ domain-containing protein [Anaerolineales bacterium]|nr:RodZ domain-containing protein [Anaerolineales bacterium]